jgi:hypothetical protein
MNEEPFEEQRDGGAEPLRPGAIPVFEFDEGGGQNNPISGHFTGGRPPMWELEHEQPWHRAAAFAFALGASMKDVAEKLGRSQPAVQNLIRQPWFQKRVSALMEEYGAKDIIELFRAEQINSLCTLVSLRDDPEVSANNRIVCARDILDRALGKPTVRVESIGVPMSSDPVAEVERLERQVNEFQGCETARPQSASSLAASGVARASNFTSPQ